MKRLLLLLLSPIMALGQAATISSGTTFQTMDGFGGQTWLYADSLTSAQADQFFSPTTGIGLEIVRSANNWDNSIPDLTTLQLAVARGAKVELGIQSPPCSLKHSVQDTGSGAGDTFPLACHTTDWSQHSGWGNGTPGTSGICFANALALDGTGGAFDQFGNYLVTTIQNYQNAPNNVPITWISLQNEADDPSSGIGACQWGTGAQFQDFIKNYLGPKLAAAGLTTKIMLDPDTHWFTQDFVTACLSDSACAPFVSIAGGHGYGYPFTASAYTLGTSGGRHLWLSETADQSNVWDPSMTSALVMAKNMHDFLTVASVSGYEWWELAYPSSGGSYGLTDSSFNPSKRFYATGNWSKFVRPGWVRISATANPQTGIFLTAFEDQSTGNFAVVAINQNGTSTSQTFNLTGLTATSMVPYITDPSNNLAQQTGITVSAGSFSATLNATSVTTFVSSVSSNCPAGANYTSLTNPMGPLVTLQSYGITNCLYVAASGSDSNNGTSEATPFLHAPAMPNATGNAASAFTSLSPGTAIILRGGDTYHFGAATAPASGGTWNFNTGTFPMGTSTNPIYVGVDPTWFSGGSWQRPILTGDNPLCNAGNLSGTCHQDTTNYWEMFYVNSCAHTIGSANDFINLGGLRYYIIDNFEMTGLCQSSVGQPGHNDNYFSYGGITGPMWFMNNYMHGWSHLQFAAANGSSGCTSGVVCMNIFMFDGGLVNTSSPPGDTLYKNVIDGSDSDPVAAGFCFGGMYHVGYNYINNTSQCVTGSLHSFHDNVYTNFYENGHSNVLESGNLSDQVGTNVVYNNIFSHLEVAGGVGGVASWPSPPIGTTDYIFNNIWWDVGQMEVFNAGQNGFSQGALTIFNNLWQIHAGNAETIFGCPTGVNYPTIVANNHYILDGSSPYGLGCTSSGQLTQVTNLQMLNSTATSNGYTNTQTFVFSPSLVTSPTVGAGTNEHTTYCNTLSGNSDALVKAGGTACLNDTTYAIVLNNTTHSISAGGRTPNIRPGGATAWDIGPYTFGSGPTNPIASVVPTSLSFGIQGVLTSSPSQTVTVTNTGGTTLTFSGYALTTGTQFSIASNTCHTTFFDNLPSGQNCVITIVFTPTSIGAKTDTLTLTDNSGGVAGTTQTVSMSGTGTTWIIYQNKHNFACSFNSAGTTQTCSLTMTTGAGHNVAFMLSGWANADTATFNAATQDGVAMTHCPSCYVAGTNSPKAFVVDAAYVLTTTSGSHTYAFTINTTSPLVNMDVEAIEFGNVFGPSAYDSSAVLGYTSLSSPPFTSPAITPVASNALVFQMVALGFGPATTPSSPYISDIDPSNVWGAFAWAADITGAAPSITWNTVATNYPATAALVFKYASTAPQPSSVIRGTFRNSVIR